MKTLTAKGAKCGFGRLTDFARAGPAAGSSVGDWPSW
jgi:hypothetical protein